jgi:hypothetical protein
MIPCCEGEPSNPLGKHCVVAISGGKSISSFANFTLSRLGCAKKRAGMSASSKLAENAASNSKFIFDHKVDHVVR